MTSALLPAGVALTQSSQTLYVAHAGNARLPDVNLWDFRISRVFARGQRWELRPELDIYDLLNSSAYTGEHTSVNAGSLFLNPQTILPPRLFKAAMKIDF